MSVGVDGDDGGAQTGMWGQDTTVAVAVHARRRHKTGTLTILGDDEVRDRTPRERRRLRIPEDRQGVLVTCVDSCPSRAPRSPYLVARSRHMTS